MHSHCHTHRNVLFLATGLGSGGVFSELGALERLPKGCNGKPKSVRYLRPSSLQETRRLHRVSRRRNPAKNQDETGRTRVSIAMPLRGKSTQTRFPIISMWSRSASSCTKSEVCLCPCVARTGPFVGLRWLPCLRHGADVVAVQAEKPCSWYREQEFPDIRRPTGDRHGYRPALLRFVGRY